jgi:hypothetical protein
MGRACSTHGARSDAYRILVGKPEGRRTFGRPGVDGRILGWIFEKWVGRA